MIGKLTGTLEHAHPGEALLSVGGVGYLVRVPLSLVLNPGDKASLFIYTAVRDDAIDLYGFMTQADLGFFKQLMSVSGIGPKTALTICGVSDITSLKRAVAMGDATALVKVFGIGKKSAERMVVELKDKVLSEGSAPLGGDSDVLEALMAMGYTGQEGRAALKHLPSDIVGVKDRLSLALKQLGSK